MAEVRCNLVVLYTTRVEECVAFYAGLGLEFAREKHTDNGREHYAAQLADGGVLEVYPATAAQVTGALRLGFVVDNAVLPPGRHLLRDPDGRAVDVLSG